MSLIVYRSVDELREDAARWDDLWLRSDVTLPTVRGELLAQWIEQFEPRSKFRACAVEHAGRLTAALPLVQQGLMGTLPRNSWCDGGDLLLDLDQPPETSVVPLVEGLRRMPWRAFLAEGVAVDRGSWRLFLDTLRSAGGREAQQPCFHVGTIEISGDWASYQAGRSSNHRRSLRKNRRKLEALGAACLVRRRPTDPGEARELVQMVSDVENRSWKGEQGTSILQTPGMLEFFSQQAEWLAAWDQLEIFSFLFQERPIAVELGYGAKEVYHAHKIGFDSEFRSFGPGQLLCGEQLVSLFADRSYRLVDTLGILGEANAKWATASYEARRVLFSDGSSIGNAWTAAWTQGKSALRRLLGRPAPVALGEAVTGLSPASIDNG